MTDTERELRRAINELLHIARMNDFMKKANSEFNGLLDTSNNAVSMLERTQESSKYRQAQECFSDMLEKIKISFGTSAVSNAYNRFKEALDDDSFVKEVGAEKNLSLQEKSHIFRKLFDLVVAKAEAWDYEQDFYSYFIEIVKEVFMPTEDINTDSEEVCPYCDGVPKRISKFEFFGPHSPNNDGDIWGCECGAYAEMDDNGKVLGKLGDAMLHQKRNLVKSAICELCSIAGVTIFESYHWFSFITGLKIQALNDVEFLDTETCNIAIRVFLMKKQEIQECKPIYPKDRRELFLFFSDGGRLLVCNAYGFQRGRLLIPSEIGQEGIRIYGRESSYSIGFADSLRYEFKDDVLYIHHPSGKKEKFKMMPAAQRNILFEFKENKNPVDKAG